MHFTILHCRFFKETHKNCSFKFDKAGGTLAHALFPDDGILHFDDDETFTDGVSSGTNLFSVTLHEIGHLLGLSHSQINIAIMHQTYKKYDPNMALTDDEKRGIEYIYGEIKTQLSPMEYRKILIISPGLIFLQKASLVGLFSGELIFGGAYY